MCTLSARFLIKSVKSDRAVKVHFQVVTFSISVEMTVKLF